MTLNANRRKAMYAGVAALAAIAGAGVAWKRQELGAIAPEALNAFWAAEFDNPTGESLLMKTLQALPPCIEEMPLIDAFFRENESKGWQVLGLAIDQPSRVRQFLTQFPVNYKIGLAGLNGTELGKMLGNDVGGLPFTVVLNANGELMQRKLGKLTPEDIKKWVI
jgi:hypothetical protein